MTNYDAKNKELYTSRIEAKDQVVQSLLATSQEKSLGQIGQPPKKKVLVRLVNNLPYLP